MDRRGKLSSTARPELLFIGTLLLTAATFYVTAAYILPKSFIIATPMSAALSALLLGIANAVLPALLAAAPTSLPAATATVVLFGVNLALIWFLGHYIPGIVVTSLTSTFLGALLVTGISTACTACACGLPAVTARF